MIIIIKLKIKLLPNLVGQPEYGPHQSGTVILSGSHVTRPWRTYELWEAMMSPDSAKWLEAMKSEMGSMYENKVWTLIDLPNDRRAKIKWIFKRKTDADSSVTIYKARIVAKGFRQVQGVDYDEIFSLVAMLKSVWIMLAIATFYEIWQMDVKTAFLNGFFKRRVVYYATRRFC